MGSAGVDRIAKSDHDRDGNPGHHDSGRKQLQLRARASDDTGTELSDSLQWESSNAEIVNVDRRGRATGRAAGRAYIRASTHDQADSSLVTVVAPPKPKPVAIVRPAPCPGSLLRPPRRSRPCPSLLPPRAFQAAVEGLRRRAQLRDKRRILDAYKPKTAQDSANMRKILEVAGGGARTGLGATATAVSAASTTAPVGVDARVHFTWRNNMGVNKKKDAPFRVELNKGQASSDSRRARQPRRLPSKPAS